MEDEQDEEKAQIKETKKDDDLLIPSEHPEEITSLQELETKMAQINKAKNEVISQNKNRYK